MHLSSTFVKRVEAFYPSAKSRRGIVMITVSVCGHFSFRAVQGAFLHQSSPFLVCRLVIKLFCGSFNDFGEIPFLGPKTARCVPKICHFLKFHIFLSAGCVYSPNIAIFGLQAFMKLLSGSLIRTRFFNIGRNGQNRYFFSIIHGNLHHNDRKYYLTPWLTKIPEKKYCAGLVYVECP